MSPTHSPAVNSGGYRVRVLRKLTIVCESSAWAQYGLPVITAQCGTQWGADGGAYRGAYNGADGGADGGADE